MITVMLYTWFCTLVEPLAHRTDEEIACTVTAVSFYILTLSPFMNHTSELCFARLNELLVQLLMVGICRLLAQCLRQSHRDRGAIVERHDVMQVILQDVEMCWML